jgi:hypothetical protein
VGHRPLPRMVIKSPSSGHTLGGFAFIAQVCRATKQNELTAKREMVPPRRLELRLFALPKQCFTPKLRRLSDPQLAREATLLPRERRPAKLAYFHGSWSPSACFCWSFGAVSGTWCSFIQAKRTQGHPLFQSGELAERLAGGLRIGGSCNHPWPKTCQAASSCQQCRSALATFPPSCPN